MSKEIDLTKPLSEFDLRYLVDRNRWDDIRQNAANLDLPEPNLPSARGLRKQIPRSMLRNTDSFDKIAEQLKVKTEEPAPEGDPTDQGGEPVPGKDAPVDYGKMKVPELKAEMDRRRQQYEGEEDQEGVDLMTYSNDSRKEDLVTALTMDDDTDTADDGS